LTKSGDSLIKVSDTGVDVVSEVFRPVGEPLYSKKATDTGFRLEFCQQILEKHQGWLSLMSQPGQGATVPIVLPPNDVMKNDGRSNDAAQ
jgi:signal transduction histidine kinase